MPGQYLTLYIHIHYCEQTSALTRLQSSALSGERFGFVNKYKLHILFYSVQSNSVYYHNLSIYPPINSAFSSGQVTAEYSAVLSFAYPVFSMSQRFRDLAEQSTIEVEPKDAEGDWCSRPEVYLPLLYYEKI